MLYQNNVTECRRMANQVIDIKVRKSLKHKATMLQTIGMSYLFEDYEQGISHLYKAKKLYDEIADGKNGEIHSSINLHQIHWGKEPEDLKFDSEEPYDKHDIIYYLVKNKKVNEAKQLIESIDETRLSDRDLAFHFFSKGLVDRNLDFMYKSILQFKKIGNLFYIRLPLDELRKQGVNDLLLKTILT
ncbi:AimR family lysis-lysogeny pheromone receptor [Alkalihalobacillus sp. LMS39]|uniref:AimR family lysis-lysogeny pheromone receptor n=1 Tax=Alkalihalobacillus sp. LMS39 TaxID=2924032 RepID=UPI001FB3E3A3|nr:AimR family lysis-lysogeny pheromone receptor [Alkalihalobacillus sp. LMS39]UOE93793.1 AimR family lysis-lysogeny pheromone receptor [Alkalihalobacillus sp. LMS39]